MATPDPIHIVVTGHPDETISKFLAGVTQNFLGKLPPNIGHRAFPKGDLSVRVETLSTPESLANPCVTTSARFGKYSHRKNSIVLDRSLVDRAFLNQTQTEPGFPCLHGRYLDLLEATIAHEFGHAIDHAEGLSRDIQFRNLVGGQKRWTPWADNRIKNYNVARTPDPYEFRNLTEAFAVNLEYFFLDPLFVCRRPALTDFYSSSLGITRTADCSDYNSVMLSSHIAADNLNRSVQLNPDSIYEIHYLHAASAPNIASRWGHAMLRLVVCADGQQPGTECLEDISDDLVLSYRANVADVTINYLDGLFGAYPSQLFIYTLPETIKEYTRIEFRDLLSVPLELSGQEISQIVNTTLERHWNYQGRYYFITNHCGTETKAHLRAAIPERVGQLGDFSPRKTLRTLPRSGLVDAGLYKTIVDRDLPAPYVFPSKRMFYNDAYQDVEQYDIFRESSLSLFLEESEAADRFARYENFLESEKFEVLDRPGRVALIANLILLERLLQVIEQKRVSERIIKALLKEDDPVLESIRDGLASIFRPPWELVDDDSYGIPAKQFVADYLTEAKNREALLLDVNRLAHRHSGIAELLGGIGALVENERYLSSALSSQVMASEPRSFIGYPVR